MGDSYRPSYPSYEAPQYYGYDQRPAVPQYPPLPLEPPPPGVPPMYNFGQQGPVNYYDRFNFQANSSVPSYPANYGSLGPLPPRADHYYPGQQHGRADRHRDQNRRDRPFRREPRPRIPTADRPLLRFQRDTTPNQLMGMDGETDMAQRFRDVRDMSDSEEEAMMESDTESNHAEASHLAESTLYATQAPARDNQSTTKWSNPEPYTALPPSQDTSRKKKDVVKMIRRARLAAKETDPQKPVAQNDDFISLDFRDEEPSKANDAEAEFRQPPPNAPNGPRSSFQTSNHNQVQRPAPVSNPQAMASGSAEHPIPTGAPQATTSSIAERLQESKKRKRSPETEGESFDEDGDIEGPATKYAKSVKIRSQGDILPKWNARSENDPVPWVKAGEHDFTESAGFRLHKEICDFFEFVKPQSFEERVRHDLIQRIRNAMKRFDQDYDVQCFGSFAAGLYLPDADMDLVVVSQTYLRSSRPTIGGPPQLQRIAAWLVREGLTHPTTMEVLAKTKIPLVKFVDNLTGLRVDMSFENITGIVANTTFGTWKAQHPAMPVLVTIIKQFLLMRRLNEVVSGGIGGFAITCLVISLLQNMPRVLTGQFKPEENLGDLLLEFLDFYGNQFDLATSAIQFNPPGLIHKSIVDPARWMHSRQSRLHIIDPNNPANDISGGSNNVELIFEKFAYARAELLAAMQSRSTKSYLQSLVGGNYIHYMEPRERLRKISRRLGNDEPLLEEAALIPALPETSLTGKLTGKLGERLKAKGEMQLKNKQAKQEKKKKKQKKETKAQSKEGDRPYSPRSASRAKAFRQNFPHFTDVPDQLSRAKFNELTKLAQTGSGKLQQESASVGKKGKKGKTGKEKLAEEEKARADSLSKEFPDFRHLIPRRVKKNLRKLLGKALIVKRKHPDLDLPTNLTTETVGQLVGRAQEREEGGKESQNPAKKRKRTKNTSTATQAIDQIAKTTGSTPIGRWQNREIGSNNQSSAFDPNSRGHATDDPIVVD